MDPMTQPIRGAVDLSALKSAQTAPTTPAAGGVVVDVTDATFSQVVQQSTTVPVVVDLWAEWCQPCKTLGPILEKLAAEYGGRFLLAKVDVDANPQVASAFQVQSIPTVVALLAGQPVPLFQGAYPESQIRQVLDQLLQVAAQNGITGTVAPTDANAAPEEPAEPELPPHHAAGLAAIEAGDYDTAEAEYTAAVKENPGDSEAKAALLQVAWMRRLQEIDDPAAAIANAVPGDLDSQLTAADAELASNNISAAFERLLTLVREGGDNREPARVRLVEYFDILGTAPEVTAARRALASALY
ncbi:MAG TPA: tetratricopeptide repeat protein [Actinomycetales bacterium]|nr:tetratricopeptide repeat protein [Actinomycetales bacterium]